MLHGWEAFAQHQAHARNVCANPCKLASVSLQEKHSGGSVLPVLAINECLLFFYFKIKVNRLIELI